MTPNRIVLAEYFTTEELTLLFLGYLGPDRKVEFQVEKIPLPLADLRQFAVETFAPGGEGTSSPRKATFRSTHQMDAGEFQSRLGGLVAPFSRWSRPGDILWLIPHNVLHYFPIHALQLDGQRLIERNPICYTPSASVMKFCRLNRRGRLQRALILADSRPDHPLLHAREQALALTDLFEPHAEIYLSRDATKRRLKQRLEEAGSEFDILHLACHGFFDSDQALKSGIMLASEAVPSPPDALAPASQLDLYRAGADDLTAEEVLSLHLDVDLVTLSACESGINEHQPGDELIGLTRALIYAGASAVLVSLWQVDEISTSILMRSFYHALISGMNKATALQTAQLALMKMSIQEVITYCDDARTRLEDRGGQAMGYLLQRDIANLRFAAHDFSGALDDYQTLSGKLDPSSQEYPDLVAAMSRCRLALRSTQRAPVDYLAPRFADPYYWAPFILVGDWR